MQLLHDTRQEMSDSQIRIRCRAEMPSPATETPGRSKSPDPQEALTDRGSCNIAVSMEPTRVSWTLKQKPVYSTSTHLDDRFEMENARCDSRSVLSDQPNKQWKLRSLLQSQVQPLCATLVNRHINPADPFPKTPSGSQKTPSNCQKTPSDCRNHLED